MTQTGKRTDSLRRRIVVAAAIMAGVITVLFGTGMYFTLDHAEDRLIESHWRADVETFMAQYDRNPAVLDLPRSNFSVYVSPDGSFDRVPETLGGLPLDGDELTGSSQALHVETVRRGGTVFYFVFDETAVERFETLTLAAIMLIGGAVFAIAVLLSRTFAGRVVRPLTDLAERVRQLDSADAPGQLPGGTVALDGEIAALTLAFEDYRQRVHGFLIREREFSADISHELRTPLAAIQGAAEVLESRVAENSEATKVVARIRRGCAQMTALTEALLFLARDARAFGEQIQPVDVADIVDDQVAAVRDLAERKGISVRVHRGSASTVKAIPAVLGIVIGNVLKNAVKYTTGKIVEVHVGASAVVIEDHGPGIDPAIQTTLFERFNRGQARDAEGNGIGLALVQRFCEQFGWALELQSNVGAGTRVALGF